MVIERLGIDLQKISDQNGTFKKSTVLQLGIRMVRRNNLFSLVLYLGYLPVTIYKPLPFGELS